MDWSVKLAKSLLKNRTQQRHHFIQRICQLAITLCLCTILISSFLIRGFEKTIEDKIFNFWSHIRVSAIGNSANPIGETPLHLAPSVISKHEVASCTPVINKGAILKHKDNIEGIILRGLDLKKQIKHYGEKKIPYDIHTEKPIILSKHTLDILNAEVGDIVYISIIDSIPKTFKARVIQSYVTYIEEFDAQIALTDIRFLQELNNWGSQEYSWIEVKAADMHQIKSTANKLYQELPDVSVDTIYAIYPQLFDWLALMKKNEIIIFFVMLLVAMVNIISTFSIFVIEKTKLIGILKVLGAKNRQIMHMLYYQVFHIIMYGVIAGNALALCITAFLYYCKPIKLDPSIYYISYAPIIFNWTSFIFINIFTVITCLISAYIPLRTIEKVSPIMTAEYR